MKGGRWRWLLTVTGLVAMSSSVWLFRDQVWAQNLREVEPGLVYRGAEQKPGPLRRIVRSYRIRTVLCLAEPEREQQAVAESLGVQWLCIPLTSTSATLTFDRLEQAAGIMADRAKQPVFFHCKRGVYRSNLAQAVYRMKYCGWTLDQAVNELRAIGYAPESGGGDNCSAELLERYYRERVLNRTVQATSAALDD